VGVYTEEAFRGRGFATAAASLVIQRVQEMGRIPVWSAGEHNIPSLAIAQKLGFVEVSRRRYVILDYD
jgi:predicted GNAT family acetyltransferase